MLASILGTLAPAIGHLRLVYAIKGRSFSIRRWVRGGAGSLWMPYTGNQVASLRGLVLGWMNIDIMETLHLEPSFDRRIWLHVDYADDMCRMDTLKMAKGRQIGRE